MTQRRVNRLIPVVGRNEINYSSSYSGYNLQEYLGLSDLPVVQFPESSLDDLLAGPSQVLLEGQRAGRLLMDML